MFVLAFIVQEYYSEPGMQIDEQAQVGIYLLC